MHRNQLEKLIVICRLLGSSQEPLVISSKTHILLDGGEFVPKIGAIVKRKEAPIVQSISQLQDLLQKFHTLLS